MTGARLAASAARLDQDRSFRLAVRFRNNRHSFRINCEYNLYI